MARRKAILTSLTLANSLFSTRSSHSQVTRFLPSSLSHQSRFPPFTTNHRIMFFSSKPHSLLELVLANDWSEILETELETLNPTLTHETMVYVLKRLDKEPQKASDFFNWACGKNGSTQSSPIYSILLRIFVQNESMKQFWITLRVMKERGFYLDEETYLTILGVLKRAKKAADATALTHFYNRMLQENAMDSVVQKVVNIVLQSEWNNDVAEKLEGLGIVLSDSFVIRVLKELRNFPLKGLSFFHWVGCRPDYDHNTVTYNAIARVLGRDDSIEAFWGLVEEMKNAGHEIDIDTYIKISRQFQRSKMMGDAVKLYELMMDGPYKPSLQDCSVLLRSISASDNPDLSLVFRVAKKFEATGYSLSKAVYDGIHRSLTSAGKFDEAENIVKSMRNAGYEPDNVTYSQLVFGLCKARRLEEACEVLDEMEAQGCVPDIKTWTILIQGHCTANEVDKALVCFAKMIEKNCDPDADLLDVLISGFLGQKKLDGAYQLLIELVNKAHLRPWQATYKHLIEKLLEVRKLEEAISLLRLMKKQNYPPFPEPFVQYISKFGTVEDAAEFLKALSSKEYPSMSAYLHIFNSFFNEGRHSEAKDLLFKCPHHIRKHSEICKLFGSAESKSTTPTTTTTTTQSSPNPIGT
ncbi:pentatricopeptide repeat-containing protein At3g48250, chloroplastic [Cucurbita pepo subsp. pepo]|uniref:pentatricopeptide repeat-containing protein At3g48250, chloroplastic n=1 Tax=Cucurbita pepo subsp. pepo TaxID=3664 RepID=UPI000C9D7CF9|nr:pentatricopeptide repeat-containing protein At3g48250, chloroplastic [Cucurbita pepo subsp. pepo]